LITNFWKRRIKEQSYEDAPPNIKSKIKQVHFINQVDQIEIALQEILKELEREIVHSCGKPEEPPGPRITFNNRSLEPSISPVSDDSYWAFCEIGTKLSPDSIIYVKKNHPKACQEKYSMAQQILIK